MDSVNKTLYIPLYGKAYVSRRGLFLKDAYAEKIWAAEGFLLKGKAKSRWLAYNMGMRAAVFDQWTEKMLEENPGAVILHLGCGLDSRVHRVVHEGHLWYDVDFPEVIAERRRYFAQTRQNIQISADLRQPQWLEDLPGGTAIVVMEGISMYLQMEELRQLLRRIRNHFASVYLLMDTYTTFAAKATRYKSPINTVGVTRVYGFDLPEELTGNTGFRFVSAHSLTPDDMIAQLPEKEQWFFRTMFAGNLAKKIYRLYEYEA